METARTVATNSTSSRVLVVDDDELLVRSYERALSDLGYVSTSARDGRQALERFRDSSFDVILSDLDMPDMDGLTFLREVRRLDLDVPVIIVTGTPSVESAVKAIDAGAFLYLVKPVLPKQLAETLERGVSFHQMARLRRQAMALVLESGHALGDIASVEARFESAMSTCRMAFQPIISWRQRRTIGYEALLRTSEPTLARPDHFIEAAGRLGRLNALGRVIRRHAAAEAEKLSSDLLLLVNLHPSDLQDDDLNDPNAPLSRIAGRTILEITERASLNGTVNLRDRLSPSVGSAFAWPSTISEPATLVCPAWRLFSPSS